MRFKVHVVCPTAHAFIIMVELAAPAGEVVKILGSKVLMIRMGC